MNFINGIESAEIQFELKYCERCDGLFLRPQAAEVVYCGVCTTHLTAQPDCAGVFSPAQPSRTRNPRMVKGPKRQSRGLPGAAQIEHLHGVAGLEVRL
jgi:hypothetical protein